ncbi:PrsW family intramembrane metalloprotease [Schaalia sp. Marseille-Q2122]|uniref:PrsW family intramembrane metalloprotease n=1 Tax=Schaalia sp. Marseille-Q2122 TaxID=2736604 RepID=UPI00158A00FA|nr:PrsW family intramembrane metalloprotease [Schaalia sp. Marseille-Q2122]
MNHPTISVYGGVQPPDWSHQLQRRRAGIFEALVMAFGIIAMLIVLWVMSLQGGVIPTALLTVAAFLPFLVIMQVLAAVDRWEREPWGTTAIVALWGGGIATFFSGIFNTVFEIVVEAVTGDAVLAQTMTIIVAAPIVEESFKGLGVVLILWKRRHRLNSILDGVYYAAVAGAAFAFIENVMYFMQGAATGGVAGLGIIFFMRGVMSPFLHPMATSMIGLAAGWTAVRMAQRSTGFLLIPAGWLAAVAIHAAWNATAVLSSPGMWIALYLFLHLPMFIVWMLFLRSASATEAKVIARGLETYVASGWLLPNEVQMVTTRTGRKSAQAWAKQFGKPSHESMTAFLNGCATLGLDEEIMRRLGPDPLRVAHDREVLQEITRHRQVFLESAGVRI